MPKIGVDTLKIGVQNFEIENGSKLVRRVDTNLESGESTEKYYFNDKIRDFHLQTGKGGLSFQFSVPKLYGLESNFYPLGANSFKTVMSSIERELADVGVVADLDNSKIMRIDIFSNAKTSETFSIYKPVLQTLGLKRAHNRQYGVDTFLMHNTLRELEFYNKLKELGKELGPSYVRKLGFNSENIVRGELRLLKHREVKDKLNIQTLAEIPDNWKALKEVYIGFMGNDVFSSNFESIVGGGANLRELFAVLANEALRALRSEGVKALRVYGFLPFFYVNEKELKKALLESKSRAQTYKILQRIKRAKKKYGTLYFDSNYKKLYSELKYKFTS